VITRQLAPAPSAPCWSPGAGGCSLRTIRDDSRPESMGIWKTEPPSPAVAGTPWI